MLKLYQLILNIRNFVWSTSIIEKNSIKLHGHFRGLTDDVELYVDQLVIVELAILEAKSEITGLGKYIYTRHSGRETSYELEGSQLARSIKEGHGPVALVKSSCSN